MNANAAKLINTLARGINASAKEDEDQLKQLAALYPDPPPPVLLAKTKTQEMIEEHYKSNTITSRSGREAYTPPPVLLAEVTPEEKEEK